MSAFHNSLHCTIELSCLGEVAFRMMTLRQFSIELTALKHRSAIRIAQLLPL
jgi:hypothetical protein